MNRMLTSATGALALALLILPAAPSSAQTARNTFTIEPDVLGGTVGYARTLGPNRAWGVELGGGGPFLNRMLLSGRHFSDEDGPSYEPRDGATDKHLTEVAHVGVFLRRSAADGRWDWDSGVRGSVFFHEDTSDDDTHFPSFLGAYTGFLVGNRTFKIGPEVLVGWFSEGSNANELGILAWPLTGRITLGWGKAGS